MNQSITNLKSLLAYWEDNQPTEIHEDDVAISRQRLQSYARHGYIKFVNRLSPYFYVVEAL